METETDKLARELAEMRLLVSKLEARLNTLEGTRVLDHVASPEENEAAVTLVEQRVRRPLREIAELQQAGGS